jgi:hypothetical protein
MPRLVKKFVHSIAETIEQDVLPLAQEQAKRVEDYDIQVELTEDLELVISVFEANNEPVTIQ